jgi:hypothetical protein
MHLNLVKELALLGRMTAKELRVRYAEVFGEAARTGNKLWLVRRIAWRLQALAEGDLTERARQRAAELANDADLRQTPPKGTTTAALAEPPKARVLRFQPDDRLPRAGTVLTRKYKGATLQVQVLTQGFAFEGEIYPSLSAVAKAITGLGDTSSLPVPCRHLLLGMREFRGSLHEREWRSRRQTHNRALQ